MIQIMGSPGINDVINMEDKEYKTKDDDMKKMISFAKQEKLKEIQQEKKEEK